MSSIKSTIQRDQFSSILVKIIFILLFCCLSACITLYATNQVKKQFSSSVNDLRKLEQQECERKMTENVNKYQEELRDRLEKEYKEKINSKIREITSGEFGPSLTDPEGNNIFSRGNAHQESQQEIILLKGKLSKLEKQYSFMINKYNSANLGRVL